MLTYCYRCPTCEERITMDRSDAAGLPCPWCEAGLRRDWKAEAVSFGRVPGGGRD